MKRKMVLLILTLFFLATVCLGIRITLDYYQKPQPKEKDFKVTFLTPEENCMFLLANRRSYCSDINICSEPCWPELRQEIIGCLQSRNVPATEEKIQSYLDQFPSPEFFGESRKLCLTWGKTEEERQKCILGYSSVCAP